MTAPFSEWLMPVFAQVPYLGTHLGDFLFVFFFFFFFYHQVNAVVIQELGRLATLARRRGNTQLASSRIAVVSGLYLR